MAVGHFSVHQLFGCICLSMFVWLCEQQLFDVSLSCRIDRNSDTAHLIRAAHLIIWDEAPMMHRHVYQYLDAALRDVTGVDALFGGKVVVLGGDFRQIPVVIPKGSRAQIAAASLKKATFWPTIKKMELTINMRLQQLSGGPHPAKVTQWHHVGPASTVNSKKNQLACSCYKAYLTGMLLSAAHDVSFAKLRPYCMLWQVQRLRGKDSLGSFC